MDKSAEYNVNDNWVKEEKAVDIAHDDHPDANLTTEQKAEQVSTQSILFHGMCTVIVDLVCD